MKVPAGNLASLGAGPVSPLENRSVVVFNDG